jgi:hypothetical protein
MPSETIYIDAARTDEPGQHIHLQWGRDYGDINIGTCQDDPQNHGDKAYYATIRTRDQVNKLIQVLRRARDQAFGKDA